MTIPTSDFLNWYPSQYNQTPQQKASKSELMPTSSTHEHTTDEFYKNTVIKQMLLIHLRHIAQSILIG